MNEVNENDLTLQEVQARFQVIYSGSTWLDFYPVICPVLGRRNDIRLYDLLFRSP